MKGGAVRWPTEFKCRQSRGVVNMLSIIHWVVRRHVRSRVHSLLQAGVIAQCPGLMYVSVSLTSSPGWSLTVSHLLRNAFVAVKTPGPIYMRYKSTLSSTGLYSGRDKQPCPGQCVDHDRHLPSANAYITRRPSQFKCIKCSGSVSHLGTSSPCSAW